MLLYHGSPQIVRKPCILVPNRTLDYGIGFYTTTAEQQAHDWALRRISSGACGYVNVYEFDETLLDNADLNIRRFHGADEPWLSFVTDCRKSRGHSYDLVQGPVADDKVFTTVNLFESGVLSAEAAIMQLKAYKTYDQLSFHTGKVIHSLRFVESFEV